MCPACTWPIRGVGSPPKTNSESLLCFNTSKFLAWSFYNTGPVLYWYLKVFSNQDVSVLFATGPHNKGSFHPVDGASTTDCRPICARGSRDHYTFNNITNIVIGYRTYILCNNSSFCTFLILCTFQNHRPLIKLMRRTDQNLHGGNARNGHSTFSQDVLKGIMPLILRTRKLQSFTSVITSIDVTVKI